MLYFLTCLYVVVYYSQPGGRIPVLGVIRFEFLLGTALLVLVFLTKWNRVFTEEKITKATFVFVAGITLSFIGAIQTHTASDAFEVFVDFLKSFSIYLMIVSSIDSKERLEKFLWVYILCMGILVVEPFLLSLRGMNMYAKEDGIVRLYGVGQFAHPNGLGINAVTTFPLIYFCFKYYRSYLTKAVLVGFTLICLRVIMLTGSRSAYVGLILFAMLLFFYSRKKMRFLAIALIFFFTFWAFVPSMYRDRFVSLGQVTDVVSGTEDQHGSIEGRWELIEDAWSIFLRYPIFGCGMDSFWRLGQKENKSHGQTHNLLMQVLAETGVVGFFSFSFFLWVTWQCLHSAKEVSGQIGDAFLSQLAETLQIFFLLKLSIGLVAQHSLYSHVWWILAGLALVSLRINRKQSEEVAVSVIEGSFKPEPTQSYSTFL